MASTSAASNSVASFFDDLVRCETRLYNAVGDTLRAKHGIVTTQFEFLRYVRDHEGARVADIAAAFAAGIGATSKGIDRYERMGWLERRRNPADRRSSLLALTDAGRRLVDAAEVTFNERLEELIEDDGNLTPAASFLGSLRSALEHARIGMPTG